MENKTKKEEIYNMLREKGIDVRAGSNAAKQKEQEEVAKAYKKIVERYNREKLKNEKEKVLKEEKTNLKKTNPLLERRGKMIKSLKEVYNL